MGNCDPGQTSLGSVGTLNWVGVVLDMLMDKLAEVGVDAGLDNWDNLFLLPLLTAEEEDDNLGLLFLFHYGVQMTLLLDVDGEAGVISVVGGVHWLLIGDVGGDVLPTVPSAWSR